MIGYLEAVQGLFLKTWFTGNRKIFPDDAPPGLDDEFGVTLSDWRAEMEKHFSFFVDWRRWVEAQPNLAKSERNKLFLKMNQMIVLKNTVFGFLQLAEYVFELRPDCYICPQRCTSNKIELYFGNIKSGSKTVSTQTYKWTQATLRLRKEMRSVNGNVAGLLPS